MLNAYQTKADLLNAFSKHKGEPDTILASMMAVYTPHIYRGGFMIYGFGYSTERIGTHVPTDRAGVPV
ncbi:MAG: hypothetical protein M3Y08_01165 [Fibrobacterota bacterium]|nr:hypothetical protein [Fibrobacterota bacterium]